MADLEQQQDLKLPPVVERLAAGEKTPVCLILVGMAGSGKTSLLAQLQSSLLHRGEQSVSSVDREGAAAAAAAAAVVTTGNVNQDEETDDPSYYCVNLDPATLDVPYDVSIDIRDTIDYKEVMKQHKLGPNGAIMTSLNLFATKFDQVMSILERRAYAPAIRDDLDSPKGSTDGDSNQVPAMEYILVDTPGQIEG